MNFLELVKKNRSYRRFHQFMAVREEDLSLMVEAARLTPSSRNIQPLKYILCNDPQTNTLIFSTLGWAGYLTQWPGPCPGERPAAYIVQLLDTSITEDPSYDPGITAQTILLQAVELGYGGCIIASVKREELARLLSIPQQYRIIHVIALGVPKEEVKIEAMKGGEFKYWRDEKGVHHLPKRGADEIIIKKITGN